MKFFKGHQELYITRHTHPIFCLYARIYVAQGLGSVTPFIGMRPQATQRHTSGCKQFRGSAGTPQCSQLAQRFESASSGAGCGLPRRITCKRPRFSRLSNVVMARGGNYRPSPAMRASISAAHAASPVAFGCMPSAFSHAVGSVGNSP